jgi:competence protein ComFA
VRDRRSKPGRNNEVEEGGRQLLINEAECSTFGENAQIRPAVLLKGRQLFCQRCGSSFAQEVVQLPTGIHYCPACIHYGRADTSKVFLTVPVHSNASFPVIHWPGELTIYQKRISQALVSNYQQKRATLVWSVTGSGKTEMIFEVIQAARRQGHRVAVVSPRIDVCRELFPRIQKAFPTEDCLLLYGDSEEDYRYTDLLVATIHQLLHFYQAFDLLIVDEVDAFPYEGDPQLKFGLMNALKVTGCLVYLSATPSEALLKETKHFAVEKMPLRFHQRPLIVPQLIWYEDWRNAYRKKRKLQRLIGHLQRLAQKNFVLVFCPSIAFMERLEKAVGSFLKDRNIASVSAKDPARIEKVAAARNAAYQILFTTTILERGVTFENVSVVVMGADHGVFSKSALVQIAGRVDRKGAFNHGEVLFFYDQATLAIRKAVSEIKEMNRLAKEWLTDEM